MIGHETIRMTNPIIALDEISEDGEKDASVIIIKEDGSPRISPGGQMINRSGKPDSQWSTHVQALT